MESKFTTICLNLPMRNLNIFAKCSKRLIVLGLNLPMRNLNDIDIRKILREGGLNLPMRNLDLYIAETLQNVDMS